MKLGTVWPVDFIIKSILPGYNFVGKTDKIKKLSEFDKIEPIVPHVDLIWQSV